jgi:polygalacturonase
MRIRFPTLGISIILLCKKGVRCNISVSSDFHSLGDDYVYLDVTQFGAVGDGVTEDTVALQRAISSSASTEKTLIVHLPANKTFPSAPLNLSSNVILHVDGSLEAITNSTRFFHMLWPQIPPLPNYASSEDNGRYLQYQSFLYASKANNITISGSGTIDGKGQWWWDAFQHNSSSLPAGRPNLIGFVNCTNVEITGVTLKDSPFWTVHPVLSSDIHIHHMTIRAPMYAPNVDGIDPDSSQNVLIEHNDISCGDDHIAIKAGRCGLGNSWIDKIHCEENVNFSNGNFKTSNITIQYNTFRTGMGIALGSEISGGLEDVHVYKNIIGLCEHGPDNPLKSCGWGLAMHFKTTLTRGGYMRNVRFQDNIIYNNTAFFQIETDYQNHGHALPPYPTTELKNISLIGNRGLGLATSMNFDCSQYLPCNEILVQDNRILHGTSDSYHCNFVETYQEENNFPPGLGDCLYHSINHTEDIHRAKLIFERPY